MKKLGKRNQSWCDKANSRVSRLLRRLRIWDLFVYLGSICIYFFPLNMHRKLTKCILRMVYIKVATTLSFTILPPDGASLPRRNGPIQCTFHRYQKSTPTLMCHFPKTFASYFKIKFFIRLDFNF